jgi:PAS domain S-box-containing protein
MPGADLTTASGGFEGLRRARSEGTDLILLDEMEVESEARDVCREVRADPLLQSVPLLAVLPDGMDATAGMGMLEAGADGVVVRPIGPDGLALQVQSALAYRAALAEAAEENESLRGLVAKCTKELAESEAATLSLLEDLRAENKTRKTTEEFLRQSEERFRSLFERAPLGYQSLDADGRFIEVNAAWLETLGYEREEVVGKWFGDFLAPECVQSFRDRFPVFKRQGRVHSEFCMKHKNGERRYVAFDGRIGYNADGTFKQTHCILADETERRRAEEELRRSRAELQQILDSVSFGIAVVDQERTLRLVNRAAAEMVERSQAGLVGVDCGEILCPDDGASCPQENGLSQVRQSESSLRHRDGHFIPIMESVAPIRLGNKDVLLESFADISDLKAAETRNLRQQHALEKAQELGKIGSWEIDLVNGLLFWSEENCRIFGVSPGTVANYELFLEKVHPDDREYVDYEWRAALDGRPYDIEHRLLIDGTVRWVREKADVEFDEAGRAVLGLGFTQDITDQRRAEEGLRASDSLLRKLSAQIPGIVYQFQRFPDGRVCIPFCTEGIRRLFGVSPEEVRHDAMPLFAHIHSDDLDRLMESIQESYERLAQWTCEFRADALGLGLRWLRAASNPEKQPDGSVIWYGHVSDITEEKKAEAESIRLTQQLQQSQRMESIGRLAGGVAHDFNNMLGVIIGNTELALAERQATPALSEHLQEIASAARHSADLTRQLLGFARKQVIAPEVLDLNTVVSGMLKMLGRLIGEDVELDWQPSPNLWPVLVDRSQIDQILANLCVNSRDAIDGVGTISIRLQNSVLDDACCHDQESLTPGEYVELTVSDDGCGMDSETLSQAFEPFFTTKEMGKGTGLGLSTVYGIAHQNGGCVSIYSEVGQGTTVRLYLPRHKGDTVDGARKAQRASQGGNETILVVEDEVAILRMATKVLERQGYRVLGVSRPVDAIRVAREHAEEIDLLLTDVIMPQMNGLDLSRRLLEINPGLKCIFMSGHTADVMAERGVLNDGEHFVQKPFSVVALAAKIREVLDSD